MGEIEVALLLDADLGDPVKQLDRAEKAVSARVGQVLARSRDHWTKPWGFSAPTIFLDRCLLVRTMLSPMEVLGACADIEKELGRVRTPGAGPTSRMLDIDILAIGDLIVRERTLSVPHPRLHERRFALAPLADVLPGWRHPELGRTTLELLNALPAE